MKQDVMEKRAGYISKNNEIIPEFRLDAMKSTIKRSGYGSENMECVTEGDA